MIEKLTKRELEVLELLCQGFGNPEIGRQIWISINIVNAHISKIIYKFQAKTEPKLLMSLQNKTIRQYGKLK